MVMKLREQFYKNFAHKLNKAKVKAKKNYLTEQFLKAIQQKFVS